MLIAEVDDYPAHLHIDLLPELQGQGLGPPPHRHAAGRARRARACPRVHLGMDAANTGARAFYDRLGFHELPSSRRRRAAARHRDELTRAASVAVAGLRVSGVSERRSNQ